MVFLSVGQASGAARDNYLCNYLILCLVYKIVISRGDAFRRLVLSDQQPKVQRYSICSDVKQRKAANPHI